MEKKCQIIDMKNTLYMKRKELRLSSIRVFKDFIVLCQSRDAQFKFVLILSIWTIVLILIKLAL